MMFEQLRAGGKLVIGQKVDDFDERKFDANRRFIGAVRNIKLSYHNHIYIGRIPVIELKVCALKLFCIVYTAGPRDNGFDGTGYF